MISPVPSLLNALLDASQVGGANVGAELNPGLEQNELLDLLAPLKLQVPQSFMEMYRWRNGCKDDHCGFYFRDLTFVSLQEAIECREIILTYYALDADDPFDYAHFLPFSRLQGKDFFGVLCTPIGDLPPAADNVISVSEGGNVLNFHSIESMLRTCIDWVDQDAISNEELELEIWRQHNPGIFE